MSTNEQLILENARKLYQLESEFLKFTYEARKPLTEEESLAFIQEAARIAEEAFQAREKIFENFLELKELRIQDKHVLDKLDQIRKGDKLHSISYYESVAKWVNAINKKASEKIDASPYSFLDWKFDDLFEDFNSWFSVFGYYRDKCRIGPIISSFKVPDYILIYCDELKESFAFRQYRSTVVLCRALLEMVLYDRLKRKGVFKNKDPKVISIDVGKEDNLNRYINMAKWEKLLNTDYGDIAHGIRKAANDILHPKDAQRELTRRETEEILFNTMKVVETLYR